MATAEKSVQPVYETRTVHVGDETRVTLSLSQEEAEVLQLILTRVGGPPSGPRGKADSVYKALEGVLGSAWPRGNKKDSLEDKYPFDTSHGRYASIIFDWEEES